MRKWIIRAVNAVLLGAVAVFVWRAVRRHWDTLASAEAPRIDVGVSWIVASAVVVWLTYLLLIWAWQTVLRGWSQHLPYVRAIRIWCVSNLGRYIPGKVWAVAGMAVLAKREGVDAWAAGASALVMQAMAVTTGAAVVIGTLPTLGTAETALNPIFVVAAVVLGTVGLALLTVPKCMTIIGKLTGGRFEPRPLALTAVAAGAASTLLSWFAYGLAFWLLAQGMIANGDLTFATAVGIFAAGYVVGLIAVFVPGGIGVREGVFFALLSPQLGGPHALVLTAASRLLMTVTEITAAAIASLLPNRGNVPTS